MKKLIEKYLEIKKIKYEKLYCKHEWNLMEQYTNTNIYTKAQHFLNIYVCKKCGEIKKMEI